MDERPFNLSECVAQIVAMTATAMQGDREMCLAAHGRLPAEADPGGSARRCPGGGRSQGAQDEGPRVEGAEGGIGSTSGLGRGLGAGEGDAGEGDHHEHGHRRSDGGGRPRSGTAAAANIGTRAFSDTVLPRSTGPIDGRPAAPAPIV